MKLSELSFEQFENLYHKNNDLQQKVYERYLEETDSWVDEYLYGKGNAFKNYEFGYCGSGFVNITDDSCYVNDLVNWVESCAKEYDLWYGKRIEKYDFVECVKYYAELVKKSVDLYCYTNITSEQYSKLEKRIKELKEKIEDVICTKIQCNYNFTKDDEISYGYDMLEWLFNENAYEKNGVIYEPLVKKYC